MKLAKIKNRIKSVVMASALSLALLAGFPAVEAQAATGSVYTCTINRCYAHPVTGVVEDSGGAALTPQDRECRRMRVSDWYFRGGR